MLLVTGGTDNYEGNGRMDHTEILEDMAGTWRMTGLLPSRRNNLRSAVLDNKILILGENIFCYINIEHLIVSYNVYI